MALEKSIVVKSTTKAINLSKILGTLNLEDVTFYDILTQYFAYTENKDYYEKARECIRSIMFKIKAENPASLCSFKNVLPRSEYTDGRAGTSNATGNTTSVNSVIKGTNFEVKTIKKTLFGTGTAYDTYTFRLDDFREGYNDNNDRNFTSIILLGDGNTGGSFKYLSSPTVGSVFGDSRGPMEIQVKDLNKWSFYSSSTTEGFHAIHFKYVDTLNGVKTYSNTITMTVNRTDAVNNSAPTIGDLTFTIDNEAVIPFTLAMITTSLTPPYNDPEGDLIDAIRIKEISTANKGVLRFGGSIVQEGDVIIRQSIVAGLLVYYAPNYDDIWGDTFRFEARDEGNGTWVE